MLHAIVLEINQGKKRSKFDSLELLEDTQGDFLVTIDLEKYHEFTFNFMNYSSDFQLELKGYATDVFQLKTAIDLLVQK
ncbi:hypothetical protein [Bacillus sp. FJAT-52991]|uniref:Uncharacterized protein n=1 Tax=Bacillus kandeliae TaxID=3129297 RepID=A0ABZ2NBR6_9BACI